MPENIATAFAKVAFRMLPATRPIPSARATCGAANVVARRSSEAHGETDQVSVTCVAYYQPSDYRHVPAYLYLVLSRYILWCELLGPARLLLISFQRLLSLFAFNLLSSLLVCFFFLNNPPPPEISPLPLPAAFPI